MWGCNIPHLCRPAAWRIEPAWLLLKRARPRFDIIVFLNEWTWNSQLLVKKYRSQIYVHFFWENIAWSSWWEDYFHRGSARSVYPWTSAEKIVRKNGSDTVIQALFSEPESWVNGAERNLRYPTSRSVPCTADCPSGSRPTTATHAGGREISLRKILIQNAHTDVLSSKMVHSWPQR